MVLRFFKFAKLVNLNREIALNKLLKIKNASLQNLLSKNALLRDRGGGLSLAQWSQVQDQLKYTPSGRIRNFDAENKKDETVVDKTEESGITTETRQYKEKKYDTDKMKTDIPAKYLNQTDSDDNWVILFSGILGAGVAAMLTNWAWMKRVQGD